MKRAAHTRLSRTVASFGSHLPSGHAAVVNFTLVVAEGMAGSAAITIDGLFGHAAASHRF